MTPIISSATSTLLIGNVVDSVGANITGLLVVAGIAIGIPLAFYLLKRVAGLFPSGR